ncbi:hypothetical protein ACTFIW_011736 [Dictyostelium discoideum]
MDTGRSHIETIIESSTHKFILFDEPTEETIPYFKDLMKKNSCINIVRCCEINYDASLFEGVKIHELCFKDGNVPPKDIIERWLEILKQVFIENGKQKTTVGIHCIAGLGRTPLLVCIALIEDGMKPLQAVEFVRSKRKNAINSPQIKFLKEYKASKKAGCKIM